MLTTHDHQDHDQDDQDVEHDNYTMDGQHDLECHLVRYQLHDIYNIIHNDLQLEYLMQHNLLDILRFV